MSDTITLDHKIERENDIKKIKQSDHPKKVIVAGPGTGKSYLFQELINEKRKLGKDKFLAITFIGKLCDSLADDLCGLADTRTMHGFAESFVLKQKGRDWQYYPDISKIILEDLKNEGIEDLTIGNESYQAKTEYYKTVGHNDVVYYAVEICKNDESKIPKFDLILIDEYQDFNSIESEFVDLLAKKNEIVIVGDDDQALYEFKGSSPDYIRNKHASENEEFESHTLRFCSRCTDVIIKYFHSIVHKYNLHDKSNSRIKKQYICYEPDKKKDSENNNKIHLIKHCPPGMIAYKIKEELDKMTKTQKIKDVLIIGEGQSCGATLKDTGKHLIKYGFSNVEVDSIDDVKLNDAFLDGYSFISEQPESKIGWRLLGNPSDANTKKNHIKNAATFKKLLKDQRTENMDIFMETVFSAENNREDIINTYVAKKIRKKYSALSRPMKNLNITICNILKSKGLGADVVFVIGFDQGRIPKNQEPTESEIYQMLVAITRAKKRIYLINSAGKELSNFINCLDRKELEIEEINL